MPQNHGFTLFIAIFYPFLNDNDLKHGYEITKQKEFEKTKIKRNINDINLLWSSNYSVCVVTVNQGQGKEYMNIGIFKMSIGIFKMPITCSCSFTTSSRPRSRTQTRNESSNLGETFSNILVFNKKT